MFFFHFRLIYKECHHFTCCVFFSIEIIKIKIQFKKFFNHFIYRHMYGMWIWRIIYNGILCSLIGNSCRHLSSLEKKIIFTKFVLNNLVEKLVLRVFIHCIRFYSIWRLSYKRYFWPSLLFNNTSCIYLSVILCLEW